MNQSLKILKFKTNINCGGCITKVSPLLNNASGIIKWAVDTSNKDKILTVQTTRDNLKNILHLVQEAGYKIELIDTTAN